MQVFETQVLNEPRKPATVVCHDKTDCGWFGLDRNAKVQHGKLRCPRCDCLTSEFKPTAKRDV